MKDIALLIMAASMGNRYGGLRQLGTMGANREIIFDYSVYLRLSNFSVFSFKDTEKHSKCP